MSYEDSNLIPCLLFVAHAEIITDNLTMDHEDVKGYALLPPNLNNEEFIHDLFSRKGVPVLRNPEGCPSELIKAVKERRVEVLEIFPEDPVSTTESEDGEPGTSLENSFIIHVEYWNEIIGPAIFSNDESLVYRDDDLDVTERDVSSVLSEDNLKVIEHLVMLSFDIQFKRDVERWSLLHFAVARNHKPLAELLLNRGMNVNVRTFGGIKTPLHIAVQYGNESMVDFLLQQGADIDAAMPDSEAEYLTPLCAALHRIGQSNDPVLSRIAEQLLENRANVNARSSFGSVLHLAVKTNNPQILRCVLQNCPDLNSQQNREVFQEALSQNNEEIISLLQNYGFRPAPDNLEKIFKAISLRDVKAVKNFVKKGANVNHYISNHLSEFYGMKPLHVAAENFLEEIAELLLNHGADINAKSIQGTPLFHATKVLDIKAIRFLIGKGARIQDEPLLLHTATEAKPPVLTVDERCGITSLERKAGVDINAENEGKTSCVILPIIEILVKHGARFDPENDSFRRNLMGHVHLGNLEVVEILLKQKFEESDVIEAMIRAIFADSQKSLKYLLSYGGHLLPEKLAGRSLLVQVFGAFPGGPDIFSTLLNYNYLKLKLIAESDIVNHINRDLRAQESANVEWDLGLDYDYYNSFGGSFLNDITKHVIKVKIAKLRINREDPAPGFSPQMKDYEYDRFKSACKSEIERLKTKKIGNSAISYYNFLDSNTAEVSIYLRNDSVVSILKSCDYKKKFPLYADIIDAIFQKGFYRKSLIQKCILTFDLLSKESSEISIYDRERILNHLSNPHLLIFSNVCRLHQKEYSVASTSQ